MERVVELLSRIAIALESIDSNFIEFKSRKRVLKQGSEPSPLMDLWNKFKSESFAAVNGVSPGSQRHKNATARWREKPSEEYWTQVILRLNRSRFALGHNEKRWVANFDFFVRPDSHNKVLEGKYDDDVQEVKRQFLGYVEVNGVQEPVYQTVRK